MQVAAQPAPLLLLRRDQAGPGRVQRLAQRDRVRRRRDLPGQVGQEAFIIVAQPLPCRALAGQ